MNYEIERKLNDKADKWELSNVQTENRELKSQMHELERRVCYLEGVNQNRYYVFERLFNLLAENEQFSDISNQLYELRGSL